MTYIEWDDDRFILGIEEFDSHHRQLFDSLKDLDSAMMEGKGREEIGTILDELEDLIGRFDGDSRHIQSPASSSTAWLMSTTMEVCSWPPGPPS